MNNNNWKKLISYVGAVNNVQRTRLKYRTYRSFGYTRTHTFLYTYSFKLHLHYILKGAVQKFRLSFYNISNVTVSVAEMPYKQISIQLKNKYKFVNVTRYQLKRYQRDSSSRFLEKQ